MKIRTYGKKYKCRHYESKHSPQTSESNQTKDYDIKPIENLPMGLVDYCVTVCHPVPRWHSWFR